MDTAGRDASNVSYRRAVAVRAALVNGGMGPDFVTAQGLGNSRPVASNNASGGRRENRRVEITISGASIGSLPYWDKAYSLR
jgi:outer membrane protein OmpA-like peptidoglycan-associated protein